MANPSQMVLAGASKPDWSVTIQSDQGGSWANVTGVDDIVFVEGAPASGPDTTTTKLRVVINNDPGGATYSWTRSGSTRISADSNTASQTTFTISAGAYTTEKSTFNCDVTIAGTTRSASQGGEVHFDGTA